MFNDERIDFTCGKIFRNFIIFNVAIAAFLLITKTLELESARNAIVLSMLNEIIIILTGLAVILYAEIKSSIGDKNDERTLRDKYVFYIKAFKWYLLTIVLAYAIEVPLYLTNEYSFPPFYFLLITECSGLAFVSYEFRKNNIHFNYTFIDSNKKVYYKKVFVNILKLVIGITAVYLVSIILGVVLCIKNLGAYFLVVLYAYLLSSISLSVLYFVISLIEKVNYDEEETPNKISKSILIAFACVAAFSIISNAANIAIDNMMKGDTNNIDITSLNNLASIISTANYFYWGFLGLTLSICLPYLKDKKFASGCTKALIIYYLVNILINVVSNRTLSVLANLYNNYHYNAFDVVYNALAYVNVVISVIGNLAVLLFTIGLFVNLKMHWSVILYGIFKFILTAVSLALQSKGVGWYVYYCLVINIADIAAFAAITMRVKGFSALLAKNIE